MFITDERFRWILFEAAMRRAREAKVVGMYERTRRKTTMNSAADTETARAHGGGKAEKCAEM